MALFQSKSLTLEVIVSIAFRLSSKCCSQLRETNTNANSLSHFGESNEIFDAKFYNLILTDLP